MSVLNGRVAVITGAGRGIGRAIAERFASEGADIAICARTVRDLEVTTTSIKARGRRCYAAAADMSDPTSTKQFCDGVIETFGTIDILVNNAGAYLERGTIADSDPDTWWKTVEVNIRGPYMVTRFLLKGFAEGGKILNFSTGKALSAGANSASYHVSKAGLHMLPEALDNELWSRPKDDDNIVPGPVATATFNKGAIATPEELLEKYKDDLPPGLPAFERLKHPDEGADLALWLAAMRVGGPTGQTFSLARRPL